MTMNDLIMLISFGWLPILICAVNTNETKFKKNIAVGVTFPYYGRDDAEVIARLNRFKKETFLCCFILIVLFVPCLFIRDTSVEMNAYFIWILLAIAVPHIPYVFCNRDLKRIKKARGWAQKREPQTVQVDLSVVGTERWLSPAAFLPAFLLCLLPLLWERDFWPVYLSMFFSCILMWAVYRFCYRNKAEAVDDNAELTKVLTRIRRYHWSKAFLIMTYLSALMSVAMSFTVFHPTFAFVLILALSAVIVVIAVRTDFHLRSMQERLTASSGQAAYVDEDDYWICGMFYYNPRDTRLLINARTGMNTTVNLARPGGIVLTILSMILLLSLPLVGPVMGYVERQEISLTVDDHVLRAKSGMADYPVNVDDIKSVTLLEELPEGLSRVAGSGFDRRISGRFHSPSTGSVQVLADPTAPPFLLVETQESGSYLFGARREEVRELYQALSGSRSAPSGR